MCLAAATTLAIVHRLFSLILEASSFNSIGIPLIHFSLDCFGRIGAAWLCLLIGQDQLIETKMRGEAQTGNKLLLLSSCILLANCCGLVRTVDARYVQSDHNSGASKGDLETSNERHNTPLGQFNGKLYPARKCSHRWSQIGQEVSTVENLEPPSSRHDGNGQGKLESDRADGEAVPCNNDAASCKFRNTCGRAPLNPITKNTLGQRINRGANQTYGEWPSFVDIMVYSVAPYYTSYCSGTLVSDRHVLTAAHCVYVRVEASSSQYVADVTELYLYLGSHKINEPDEYQQDRGARSVCVAKNYKPSPSSNENDWALIELNEPVELNDHIQPACLPFESIQTRGYTAQCWQVGTGLIHFEPQKVRPKTVQKLKVQQYSCPAGTESSIACYANGANPPGTPCSGDSGGPVLCLGANNHWTQVAVYVSKAYRCSAEQTSSGARYMDLKTILKDVKAQCHF